MNPFVSIEKIGKRFARKRSRFVPKGVEVDDEDDELEEEQTPSAGASRRNWALKDINAEIKSGERVALIGANGAGKSLLLRIIAGTCLPSEGMIRGRGRVVAFNSFLKPMSPRRSGLANIQAMARLLRVERSTLNERLPAIAAFAGVSDQLSVSAQHYSSSMFPRLAAAAMLHLDPDILLFDDTFYLGDASFRQKLDTRLAELIGDGATLIFAGHKMSTLTELCERALWLSDGQLAADGPIERTIIRYRQKAEAWTVLHVHDDD